jgi:hypothetical protein
MHAMPFETSLARARHHHRDAREMAVTGLSTGFHAPRHRPGAQCVETAEFLWKPRPHRPVQVGGSSKMEMVTSRRRGTVQGQGPCRTLRLCDYPFTEEFTQLAACAVSSCACSGTLFDLILGCTVCMRFSISLGTFAFYDPAESHT